MTRLVSMQYTPHSTSISRPALYSLLMSSGSVGTMTDLSITISYFSFSRLAVWGISSKFQTASSTLGPLRALSYASKTVMRARWAFVPGPAMCLLLPDSY